MSKTAVPVLHHDDPPCNARLARDGSCPKCGVHPDMQSTCIYYHCPVCDARLHLRDDYCPKCGAFAPKEDKYGTA